MNQEILQAYLRQEETPAYIFDLDMLKSRVRMMKTILGERAEICFAMKANPFLIGPLKDTADKFEVCSPGEFHICETVGIPMERIVLSGVNKEKCDITHAMHTYGDAGVYTVEIQEAFGTFGNVCKRRKHYDSCIDPCDKWKPVRHR